LAGSAHKHPFRPTGILNARWSDQLAGILNARQFNTNNKETKETKEKKKGGNSFFMLIFDEHKN